MSTQARKPKGTPVGGQFASQHRAESSLELAPEPMKEVSRGRWEVVDTVCTHLPSEDLGTVSISRTMLTPGGVSHRKAQAGATGVVMTESDNDVVSRLMEMDGKKVTVLTQSISSGSVDAQEGTVLVQSGGLVALMNKGSRTKGRYIAGKDGVPVVLAVREGYGKQESLAALYREYDDATPKTEPPIFDDIPIRSDYDSEPPSDVAAVFLMTHPGFDGSQDGRGCLFFATDRDPEDVVNGYFIAPSGSGLFSENGSFTVDQLTRNSGRVKDYKSGSLTFRDAMKMSQDVDSGGSIRSVYTKLTS